MTGIMNGNRFVYIRQLEEGNFLPRTSYCAGLRCMIYHYGQPKVKRTPLCTNCWEESHYKRDCQNDSRCKVCKQPGHDPGDKDCSEYVEKNPNITVFSGKDNVLSNFYPCQINIFGITHKSAEHAVHYVKSMRSGDVPRATAIQEAATALDAKKIGNQVVPSPSYTEQRETIMKEIVEAKTAQVPAFKEALQKSQRNVIFVETTYDDFWASGLSKHGTIGTKPTKWPGMNTLGRIIGEVAKVYRRTSRSWSVPRNTAKTTQMDISTMLQELKSLRKRSRSGRRRTAPEQDRDGNPPGTESEESDRE